jgi:hypothetical protein
LLPDNRDWAIPGVVHLRAAFEVSQATENCGQDSERRPEKPPTARGLVQIVQERREGWPRISKAEQ